MTAPSPLPATTDSPQDPDLAGAPAVPPQASLADLFLAFAAVSLSGFGGVLAWSRRMMVEQRRWMTAEEFNEAYALCAFLPGPNIVNFSVIFGSRIRGPFGAGAALIGLLAPPMALVVVLGALYGRYGDLAPLRRALIGVAAAAAGLIMATVAKMAKPLFRDRAIAGPLIGFATFAAVGLAHWPLPAVLAVALPVSLVAAWIQR